MIILFFVVLSITLIAASLITYKPDGLLGWILFSGGLLICIGLISLKGVIILQDFDCNATTTILVYIVMLWTILFILISNWKNLTQKIFKQ